MNIDWHHAKHDRFLPRYINASAKTIQLPTGVCKPKAVIQCVKHNSEWWLNGSLYSHCPQSASDARIIVNTKHEKRAVLEALGECTECIALDEWFGTSENAGLDESISMLQQRLCFCQTTLRVDFTMFSSILSAWKWRNLKRIAKNWRFEFENTHRWLSNIDDRPWQEARMAYDIESRAGAVIDISSAYASAVESMPFPKAGVPWIELRAGQRQEHAMHCIVWEPTDSIGRFYHPFWFVLDGARALPGYPLGDRAHCWVLDHDLPWLTRHGIVHGVYQSVVPGKMSPHPLASSISTWRQLLLEGTQDQKAVQKLRLVSAHSWTWQPKDTMLIADPSDLHKRSAELYYGEARARLGGLHIWDEPGIGLVAKDHDPKESGWYTPLAWIRLHLRSHLMRKVEHVLNSGLEIAYVNIDGLHVRSENKEAIEQAEKSFSDILAPWWIWRIDRTFQRGFWFRPGSYALQDLDGHWDRTNVPQNITGKDWPLWCQSRGALDVRKKIGYWRRPSKQGHWDHEPFITVHAQRYYRNIVNEHLQS